MRFKWKRKSEEEVFPEPPKSPDYFDKLEVKQEKQDNSKYEILAKEYEAEHYPPEKLTELFQQYCSEHEARKEAYKFSCKKYGDFLSLFIEGIMQGEIRKYSTTINLGLVKDISLETGFSPNRDKSVRYKVDFSSNEGKVVSLLHENYVFRENNFFFVEGLGTSNYDGQISSYGYKDIRLKYKTKNYPTEDISDQIFFSGL